MRSLFLGLLLLNILYWVWSNYVSQPDVTPSSALPDDLPRLELVSGASKSKLKPEINIESSSIEQEVETVVIDHGSAIDIVGEDDDSESTDPLANTPITIAPQDANSAIGAAPEIIQSVVPSVEGSRYVSAVDPDAHPASCVSVGPFVREQQAIEIISVLSAQEIKVKQREKTSEVWVGHWVHLPAYPSREAAVLVVERLRREGVEDIYIESSGELINSVSLGLFSDLERAEIRAGNVRKLGVKPQIGDRYRDGLVYWLDISLDSGYKVNLEAFDQDPLRPLREEKTSCE